MNKSFSLIRLLVYTGLMIAVVTVVTMAIPLPSPIGFWNIGDSMVMISALLLGPIGGFLAGGFGSALADLLLGWGAWAPWSLVIKGLEGLVIGLIASKSYHNFDSDAKTWLIRFLPASIIGVIVMVGGYWLAAGIMAGNMAAGAVEVPGNLIQGGISIVIATMLGTALRKFVIRR